VATTPRESIDRDGRFLLEKSDSLFPTHRRESRIAGKLEEVGTPSPRLVLDLLELRQSALGAPIYDLSLAPLELPLRPVSSVWEWKNTYSDRKECQAKGSKSLKLGAASYCGFRGFADYWLDITSECQPEPGPNDKVLLSARIGCR
jgi:hypothetical protein